jgi:hypothetical protein
MEMSSGLKLSASLKRPNINNGIPKKLMTVAIEQAKVFSAIFLYTDLNSS